MPDPVSDERIEACRYCFGGVFAAKGADVLYLDGRRATRAECDGLLRALSERDAEIKRLRAELAEARAQATRGVELERRVRDEDMADECRDMDGFFMGDAYRTTLLAGLPGKE